MPLTTSHRPHDPGNDYYAPGIYLITLVVRGRKPVLGRLNMDARNPGVELTPLGEVVRDEWEATPLFQAKHGRNLRILAQSVMPDHWHSVVEVLAPMDRSLGFIIQGYKSVCTSRWRKLRGVPSIKSQPCTAETIRRMSRQQRAQFYASPEGAPFVPLFDDDYDDTICLKVYDGFNLRPGEQERTRGNNNGLDDLPQISENRVVPKNVDVETVAQTKSWHYDERHLDAMVHYVEDNPRRAIIRNLYPDFLQRCMHVQVAGRDYAAFGNLFLLRWPDKRQVFFHRKAQPNQTDNTGRLYPLGTPYVDTVQYQHEKEDLLEAARSGQCVLVSPGISEGEKQIKNIAIDERLPFIHLQKEPFGKYKKPERSRFDACAAGSFLILAPWQLDGVSDYAQFHNMNAMAAEIAAFLDEAILKA